MSSEFAPAKLGMLIEFANGKTSPERSENGQWPVYGSNGPIGTAEETNSASETIVIGRVGSYCGSVYFSPTPCWVTDNAIRGTAKGNNSATFLYYLLKQLNLNNWRSGSGQPLINQSTLNAIDVRVPKPSVQREIGRLLSSVDDRITLLRETNATLEAIAQAVFKSWFVDFDPVRAKAEGRSPDGMDEATAALFPDAFEESELGPVPRGWKVSTIGDCVTTVGGATPDTKNERFWQPAEHRWTSPKDLSGSTSPILLDTERRISSEGLARIGSGLLPRGTLLMSSRAPIGYLAITAVPVAINQGYIAMPPGSRLAPLFMYFWCKQNMNTIKDHANGSTFMEISKKAFRPLELVVPPEAVVQSFLDIAEPLFRRIEQNERQAQTLATLRDTLLPRLISGQLRLPEAKAAIEEAGA